MSSSIRFPQSRWPFAVAGFGLFWIFLFTFTKKQHIESFATRLPYTSAARNRTLGVGAILMAILPDRTDQIDTASLLSFYSDIDLTIIDGVTSVLEKTRPPGNAHLAPPELGCWRAHMDMMRYVVDHRLETALILEADADWDERIKDQLVELGRHMPGASKAKPYGLEWDILYPGASLHEADGAHLGPAIRYHDNTVGTLGGSGYERMHLNWVARDLGAYQAKDHQRIVHTAYTAYATTSYMVTFEGARRILYQLALDHQLAAVDADLYGAIQRRQLDGLIVVPPLFQQWKTGSAKDSDIENSEDEGRASSPPTSGPCIKQSIRASLHDRAFNQTRVHWTDRTDLKG